MRSSSLRKAALKVRIDDDFTLHLAIANSIYFKAFIIYPYLLVDLHRRALM